MSDMLKELAGKRCSIKDENDEYLTGSPDIACDVLETDGEWIKIAYTDRTGRRIMRMDRIDSIENVQIYT